MALAAKRILVTDTGNDEDGHSRALPASTRIHAELPRFLLPCSPITSSSFSFPFFPPLFFFSGVRNAVESCSREDARNTLSLRLFLERSIPRDTAERQLD